ncbi:hypothetical protein DWW50_12920 [Eubacterium sp. AF15-50]|uniref:hypothetical protein n=1 Tax=unclassified Eubacterium (in: firmicutes) TaxID=2624479 RepID=UPI000E4C72DE|nr:MULTISPECIES: hypothetical protein [unclassified Eubacterium (in: firmicutes)]RHR72630.1 hypothetical protein DWW68_06495 [Eubacterium sp. AF16-48]RHR75702.1 hypothetical protein DWW50_12920 [Eubacterium sp. AF15-50]
MNIIELVKELLTNYPKMKEFTNKIHIDFTRNEPSDFGLSSTGDTKIKEDILGNQTRKHNFVLYAINQAFNDYDRLANSTFLLELSYWLELICENEYEIEAVIDNKKRKGFLKSIECANAMLFQIPTGDINDGCMYQIQIYATYTLESEE